MIFVLDTDVIVAAVRSPNGASRKLLNWLLDDSITVVASVPLVLEYEAVLTRADHLHASGLSAQDMAVLLDTVVSKMKPIEVHYLWLPMLQDIYDEMVLETAINGYAGSIVTFNAKHFAAPATKFGIEVLTPGSALKRIVL